MNTRSLFLVCAFAGSACGSRAQRTAIATAATGVGGLALGTVLYTIPTDAGESSERQDFGRGLMLVSGVITVVGTMMYLTLPKPAQPGTPVLTTRADGSQPLLR